MDAFSIAELAEEVAGEIYQILAEFFADKPALNQLFLKLADEEREHAERIRDLARVWQQGGGRWKPALDVERMARLVERAQAFRDSLREVEVIDPYDAIRLAASIENDFNAAHAEAISKERNPEMRALFEELAAGDEGHNELLRYLEDLHRRSRSAPKPEPAAEPTPTGDQASTVIVTAALAKEKETVVAPEKYRKWLKGAEEQLRRTPTEATAVVLPQRKGKLK